MTLQRSLKLLDVVGTWGESAFLYGNLEGVGEHILYTPHR